MTSVQPTYQGDSGTGWAQKPGAIPGCPPGLEFLAGTDQINIKQQTSLLEAMTGWEQNNKYCITNKNGQQMYFAAEDSDGCARMCCDNNRGFVMHIFDNANNEVIKINREYKSFGGCFDGCCACIGCCAHELTVESPPGYVVGHVIQKWHTHKLKMEVQDADHNPQLLITAPSCMSCSCEPSFSIRTPDTEEEIGSLTKKWAGLVKEHFTDSDNFECRFPEDLSVKTKATLIGAQFMIDFVYFESKKGDD